MKMAILSKRNLLQRHYKEFSKFINSISFEELNAEGNNRYTKSNNHIH